jgi:two-component system chemotaxis response regulator CheB
VIVNSGVGGFVELVNLIQGIRPDTRATVIGLQTIPPAFCRALLDYVGQRSSLPVAGIEDRTRLWAGHCYLGTNGTPVGLQAASRNGCFLQTGGSVGASSSREYNYFDIFLHSVAAGFDGSVMVVLLSGADLVSNRGLKAIREGGGSVLVQKLSRAVSPDTLDAVVADGIATAEAETDELIEQISGFAIPPAK